MTDVNNLVAMVQKDFDNLQKQVEQAIAVAELAKVSSQRLLRERNAMVIKARKIIARSGWVDPRTPEEVAEEPDFVVWLRT